jgi:Ribonuclease G/E
LGAKKKRLTDQIDELATQGKITEPLKEFAHEIRVTRNMGAHPDKDGLEEVTEQDAKDIVEFTREFLHHVYVMPAKLKARKTPAPAAAAKTP